MHTPAGATPPPQAQSLRTAGLRALAAGDLSTAARELEAAYRLLPDEEGLFLLARLAWAEGRTLLAQDLALRALAETDAAGAPPGRREEAARMLAVPGGATGDLDVLGPAGAWIVLDGRTAGRLPLSQPLRLAAGEHEVVVQAGGQVLRCPAQVPPGRTGELRAQLETGSLMLTLLPPLAVVSRHVAVPAQVEPLLARAVAAAARRERLSALAGAEPASCAESLDCLDELARRRAAAYALDEHIVGPGAPGAAGWAISLRLLAAATGELAATRELRCADCSPERAAVLLEQGLAEVLQVAAARPAGRIELRSEPAGAEVFSDGHRLGKTPLERSAWVGPRRLELRLRGHTPRSAELLVEEGKASALRVELQPLPREEPPQPAAAPPPAAMRDLAAVRSSVESRAPRPRWRLITGGASLALGAVLIGLGASALAVDGQCSSDTPASALACRSTYASGTYGAALLGVGAAVGAAGAALMIWPGRKPAEPALP
ncbi:MAG: PEGA domain-containing protein [Polyangia bacterium]